MCTPPQAHVPACGLSSHTPFVQQICTNAFACLVSKVCHGQENSAVSRISIALSFLDHTLLMIITTQMPKFMRELSRNHQGRYAQSPPPLSPMSATQQVHPHDSVTSMSPTNHLALHPPQNSDLQVGFREPDAEAQGAGVDEASCWRFIGRTP